MPFLSFFLLYPNTFTGLWSVVNLCRVLIVGDLQFGCKTSSTLFKTNFVLEQCGSMGFVCFEVFWLTKEARTWKTARGTVSLRILSHFSQHWPELFFTLLIWHIIPLYDINCINGNNFITKSMEYSCNFLLIWVQIRNLTYSSIPWEAVDNLHVFGILLFFLALLCYRLRYCKSSYWRTYF